MKTYKVVVSDPVRQELIQHAAFLAHASPEAAERLVDAFATAADSLHLMPERCSWLQSEFIPTQKYRSILFEKRYMLIFRITADDTVHIEHMIDTRANYQWLLL